MTVQIRIPANMRALTERQESVEIRAGTVGEALERLLKLHPQLTAQLRTPDGQIPSFINVFVNETSIREIGGLATPVCDGDEILIIPALAGG